MGIPRNRYCENVAPLGIMSYNQGDIERDIGKSLRLKQVNKVKMPKFLDEYVNIKTVA